MFQRTSKLLLSLFLIYHVITMVVLANGSSYLGRSLGPWLTPYANSLGLNTTWNFFSPDPAHTMYLRVVVRFLDAFGVEQKESIEFYVPPGKEKISLDSGERRFLYTMRFMLLDPRRLETVIAPYFCREFPEASEIFIEHILEKIPNLDSAQVSGAGERDVIQANEGMLSQTVSCHNREATHE
ncbi:MAG: hypothetical protein ACK5RO_08385 [Pseudobdellovibrionaceae bacterium]|jgi:hypothetical protein